jgi:hypothetical protein
MAVTRKTGRSVTCAVSWQVIAPSTNWFPSPAVAIGLRSIPFPQIPQSFRIRNDSRGVCISGCLFHAHSVWYDKAIYDVSSGIQMRNLRQSH